MNRTILLCCFLVFTLQIFSQENRKATKFSEYNEGQAVDLNLLEEKAKQFTKRLKKENKTSQGLVFIYHAVPRSSCNPFLEAKNYFAPRDEILKREFESQKENIIREAGGFRRFFAVEFWIIPKGAEKPKSTPDYSHINFAVCCPSIEIKFENTNNKTIVFTAELSGGNSSDEEPVFRWKTLAGEIISGQGTKQIEVDVSKVNFQEITVMVELEKGVNEICPKSASYNATIQTSKQR